MEWILLMLGLLGLAYMLIRLTDTAKKALATQGVNATNSLPEHRQQFFLLQFFHPQEPFYSPRRGYIWDPYSRRWIRNHEGDGWMGFLFGIIICFGLLWMLGIIG